MLVVHTREGHRPDLRDMPPHKRARLKRIGARVFDEGLTATYLDSWFKKGFSSICTLLMLSSL